MCRQLAGNFANLSRNPPAFVLEKNVDNSEEAEKKGGVAHCKHFNGSGASFVTYLASLHGVRHARHFSGDIRSCLQEMRGTFRNE